MRGAFVRVDGSIIPNNITDFGATLMLQMALQNTDSQLWVGLCSATYDPGLTVAEIAEPTIAVNGYVRYQLTRDVTGFPTISNLNGETYIESDWLEWTAAVGSFDKPITRMFICTDSTLMTGSVFALSAALPEPITIGLTTDELDRKFKYRLYLR